MKSRPSIDRTLAIPSTGAERATSLNAADLHDLCDATVEAIRAGGGFGWVRVPAHDVLDRYWQGVMAMPARQLFVARLDGAICGVAQLVLPARSNEAQSFAVQLTGNFIAPWARGHGLARLLLGTVEAAARQSDFAVINLDVRETQAAAIALYEGQGYQLVGTHPFYARVDGRTIPGRYYAKLLDPVALGATPQLVKK